ncbi:hypothetical protein [Deinococcus xianganensis]|uniref:Uncharacterized protein n=1 Tax=Deinococcus xianganensis TaxID=1507289 RepID=A0A6I4YGY0_9DEIO|nr:hypothetical protein [Deinococcus xianganensis]MXV20792.1 hypothetical protein [Deinococcus xianganensis]
MTEREALLDCIAIVAGRGPVTLADLASRYRLPVNAAWALVQTLLERGVLERGERVPVKRGRPRQAFVLASGSVLPHIAHTIRPAFNGIIRGMETSQFDLHTANQTDKGLRYSLTQVREFPSHDGGGFSAKLRDHGKVIGWVTDHGHGGPATVHVDAPHLSAYQAFLAQFKVNPFAAEELLVADLLEAHDMEKEARRYTPLRSSKLDEFDTPLIAKFSQPNCTRDQLTKHPQITPDFTHFWQRGHGWQPLR